MAAMDGMTVASAVSRRSGTGRAGSTGGGDVGQRWDARLVATTADAIRAFHHLGSADRFPADEQVDMCADEPNAAVPCREPARLEGLSAAMVRSISEVSGRVSRS